MGPLSSTHSLVPFLVAVIYHLVFFCNVWNHGGKLSAVEANTTMLKWRRSICCERRQVRVKTKEQRVVCLMIKEWGSTDGKEGVWTWKFLNTTNGSSRFIDIRKINGLLTGLKEHGGRTMDGEHFESTSCTLTMSSTRSFISSLSIDGSVANLDGSSFHLIGAPHSSDQNLQQHKRKCAAIHDEGSLKCESSSRCHCSMKRKHRVKRSIKVPAITLEAQLRQLNDLRRKQQKII